MRTILRPPQSRHEAILRDFLASKPVDGVRHFANAHFPDMYSLVLDKQGDCLTRIFVAKPDSLCLHLQKPDGRFLWHSHEASFEAITAAGTVTNVTLDLDPYRPDSSLTLFHLYALDAGITSGKTPTMKYLGQGLYKVHRHPTCYPGESYHLDYDKVHRVLFHPCPVTGWFACIIRELGKHARPSVVYSQEKLTTVPFADSLYREISDELARDIVSDLFEAVKGY